MIEQIQKWDESIVLFINGMNNPFFDEIMWQISGRIIWIPLYLLLFYLSFRKFGLKMALFYAVFMLACFAFSDIFSNQLKYVFERPRPSHNELIKEQLHFYQLSWKDKYLGGSFGFVSSHASNFFTLLTGFYLILGKTYPIMSRVLLVISIIVCYSRIYLGVHYLSDILAGAFLGFLISYSFHRFVWKKLFRNWKNI